MRGSRSVTVPLAAGALAVLPGAIRHSGIGQCLRSAAAEAMWAVLLSGPAVFIVFMLTIPRAAIVAETAGPWAISKAHQQGATSVLAWVARLSDCTDHARRRCRAGSTLDPDVESRAGVAMAEAVRARRLTDQEGQRLQHHRTHVIRYFHGCYSLADDQLWGVTRLRKGGDHTLAALKSIRAARPGGAPIYVICDNLSANKTPAIRA